MEKYITHNENDTIAFARSFAESLNKDDIIVLSRRFGLWENQIYSRNT